MINLATSALSQKANVDYPDIKNNSSFEKLPTFRKFCALEH